MAFKELRLDSLGMKTPRKLQPYQVVLVRQMRREGFTRKFMSRLFGISRTSLNQLLAYATYKEIT